MDYFKYKGLSNEEVLLLKTKYGENSLSEKRPPSLISIYLSQFKNPLIYVLLFAASISLIFKEYTDLALIGMVIFINSLLGFYQEYNAQKNLNTLRSFLKPKCTVIRNGKRETIETKELVPSDLVILTAGDKIPADGTLIEGVNVFCQEAILTGEEEAVRKKEGVELFMGTTVLSGKGVMQVSKTGRNTQIGKINESLISIKEEKTNLQRKMEDFSRTIAKVVFLICAIIFVFGIINKFPFWEMLKISIVLSVSSIPEGLPIAVTVILSLGMRRILQRKGLVKKLISVENLSSVTVICTDKTGTLTEGIMKVVGEQYENQEEMFKAMILSNERKSALEICLWEYVKNKKLIDMEQYLQGIKYLHEEGFDSEKKYSFVVIKENNKETAFILGAPEIVLNFCNLNQEEKNNQLAKINSYANKGLRMLAAAFKDEGNLKEKQNFNFLGFVAIEDPLREGVKETLQKTLQAGIAVKIVTGDYVPTAVKVAKDLGFKMDPSVIMDGKELENISLEELEKKIQNILVFARISPHHKLKIVEALQNRGEVVAMVGDGVNDALALKKADVGICVSSASDVSREVSDLLLLDNNFRTIIAAISEGRLILSNIKKVIGYVLSNSFGEVTIVFMSLIFHLPLPLTVIQILFINLICDGPPDIALGFEKNADHLMREKPQKIQKYGIFDKSLLLMVIAVSLTVGLISLFFFYFIYRESSDLTYARSLVFSSFGLASLVYIFSFKNLHVSLIRMSHIWDNKLLIISVIYGILLLGVALYFPPLSNNLGLTSLSLIGLLPAIIISIFSLFWIELIKYINNHRIK